MSVSNKVRSDWSQFAPFDVVKTVHVSRIQSDSYGTLSPLAAAMASIGDDLAENLTDKNMPVVNYQFSIYEHQFDVNISAETGNK